MSKLSRIVVGVLFTFASVTGPAVMGLETAHAKRDIWCC